MSDAAMRLGASTFGFLYRTSLDESLRIIAEAGYRDVELAPQPPHMPSSGITPGQVRELRKNLESNELRCTSLNPPELNLISANGELRELAVRQYVGHVRLAAELGAGVVVVVPGRQNILIPRPVGEVMDVFRAQIERVIEQTEGTGVSIALETSVFGFLERTTDLIAFVDGIDHDRLGIAVDLANIFGKEDPIAAVQRSAHRLIMAQLSDTWATKFSHTSAGRGEADFREFRIALEGAGYRGPVIYELVDGEDPGPRLEPDARRLELDGWKR